MEILKKKQGKIVLHNHHKITELNTSTSLMYDSMIAQIFYKVFVDIDRI